MFTPTLPPIIYCLGSRGGRFITSGSASFTANAIAGNVSVTKLINRICTALKKVYCGKKIVIANIAKTSAMLQPSRS